MSEEKEQMHPTLSKGDPFIINDPPQRIKNQMGLELKVFSDWDGAVFEAIEVCPPHVAAAIVGRGTTKEEPAVVISLNYARHDIQIVTDAYAEAIRNSAKPPKGPDYPFDEPGMLGDMHNEEHRGFSEGP